MHCKAHNTQFISQEKMEGLTGPVWLETDFWKSPRNAAWLAIHPALILLLYKWYTFYERMKLVIFTLRQSILDGKNITFSVRNILSKHIEYSLLSWHKKYKSKNQISLNGDFTKNMACSWRRKYYTGIGEGKFQWKN
jgi:hypothetical protein